MENNGIPYFPVEVDIFDDPKVIPTMCHYGEDTERVLIRLLCSLYREGYFLEYNEAVKFSLSMKTRKDPDYVDSVVRSLVKYKFFDPELFEKDNVLTSRGIQKRWFQATRKRTRKNLVFKHWLLETNDENSDTPSETIDQAAELEKMAEEIHNLAEGDRPQAEESRLPSVENGQSKVKESIEEKIVLLEKRQKAFYSSLKPFVDSFPPKMLREFYDYWSEPNKSKSKIRYEMERTWDVSRRLKRWADNDKFGRKNYEPDKTKAPCQNNLPLPKEMLERMSAK